MSVLSSEYLQEPDRELCLPGSVEISMRYLALFVCSLWPLSGASPMESSITEFRLNNGMKWIVAPGSGDAALLLYIDAGSAQETPGRTGLVAVMGDMWRLDSAALEKSGTLKQQVLASDDRIIFRSTAALLKSPQFTRFDEAKASGIERNNKMIRDGGSLLNDFIATAFLVHPYRNPYYGFPGDIGQLTAADARSFCGRYFLPTNAIGVAAGGVSADQIRALAEKHFGPIASGPAPENLRTTEPAQQSERRLVIHGATRPAVVLGYHGTSIGAEEAPAHGVLRSLAGRRLKARLLEREKLVSRIDTMPYPAMKYPFLMMVLSFVNAGGDPAAVERIIHEELAGLASAAVPEEEFRKALGSGNDDPVKLPAVLLATELADWHAMSGSWRSMFRYGENKAKVTPEQVQNLARRLFVPNQRTVAITQ